MAGSINSREKRLAELKREVTNRGFDRHASVLNNVLELPTEFQSPALMTLIEDEDIQTILVFPPQIQHGWDYIPRQALLFTPVGVIHLLASISADQEPSITYVKSCDIMYIKVTLVLLYGLLEIVAHGDEAPIQLEVEFNTVAWSYLSQPLKRLLHGGNVESVSLKDTATDSSPVQLDLKKVPLKFSNGVQIHGLLPGERLEELVFQPSLRKRWLLLFRRNVIANTLLFLSTNCMVVIQEDLDVEQGWVLSYIPRNCISGMQNRSFDLWNELIVQLKRGDQTTEYRMFLRPEAIEDWRMRWIQHGGQWQDIPAQTVVN